MKIDVWVVIDGDEVMGVYDTQDEAERMTNSYYDAEVQGPFELEVTGSDGK